MKTFDVISPFLILLLFLFLLETGCSSSEQTSQDQSEDPQENVDSGQQTEEEVTTSEKRELSELLTANRSQLSDTWSTKGHDMPEAFMERDTASANANRNSNVGFRVQILSVRNVNEADSLSNAFKTWADTTMYGYKPRAYVLFQQPFYKVHVGDFHNQSKALELSDLLKERHPEAWVVHDEVNPDRVPADTAIIDTLDFHIPLVDSLLSDSLGVEPDTTDSSDIQELQ